jgi:hypothetical protein
MVKFLLTLKTIHHLKNETGKILIEICNQLLFGCSDVIIILS